MLRRKTQDVDELSARDYFDLEPDLSVREYLESELTTREILDSLTTREILDELNDRLERRGSNDVAKAIIAGRHAKGWSQKELATQAKVQSSLIQQYEQGTASPDSKVLSILERVLRIKLRGSNIGQKL